MLHNSLCRPGNESAEDRPGVHYTLEGFLSDWPHDGPQGAGGSGRILRSFPILWHVAHRLEQGIVVTRVLIPPSYPFQDFW